MMTINIETIEFSDDFMMSYGYFVLELSKEEIKSINDIKIVKNGNVLM